MKVFKCNKCHSTDVFIAQSGNNTGLYCSDCGKWLCWINKDQLRLAERQISLMESNETLRHVIEALDNLKKRNPSQEIVVEIPGTVVTLKIGEAIIYEGMGGEIVIDSE